MSRQITLASGGTISSERLPNGEVALTIERNGVTQRLLATPVDACRVATMLQNTAGDCIPRPVRFLDLLRSAG